MIRAFRSAYLGNTFRGDEFDQPMSWKPGVHTAVAAPGSGSILTKPTPVRQPASLPTITQTPPKNAASPADRR